MRRERIASPMVIPKVRRNSRVRWAGCTFASAASSAMVRRSRHWSATISHVRWSQRGALPPFRAARIASASVSYASPSIASGETSSIRASSALARTISEAIIPPRNTAGLSRV